MTLIIEITPQLEARLRKRAKREGRDESEIARLAVEQFLRSEEDGPADLTIGEQILSELERENVLGIWQDRSNDTAELATEFRNYAESRGASG